MNTKYIHIGKSTILWEKTSFSRAFKFLKNNSLSRAELSDDNGNVKNIHYGDILIKFSECLYADERNNIPYIINDNIAYKLLKLSPLINGDIVFADAAEDNTVGKCTEIITHNDTDLVAGLHTIPCRPTIKFAEGYLGYYLNSTAFHNQLLQYIQGTKISSISKKSICQTIISYPSEIINQQKIASYFQSLDSLIQTTSKELASLKQIKAASLQSMFPQEEETVPKVRFKGFEEEWSLKYVFELLCERNELSPQSPEFPLMAFIANNGIAEKGERYDRSALVNDVINKQYKRTYYGDFIYSSNNLETGSIGLNTYGADKLSDYVHHYTGFSNIYNCRLDIPEIHSEKWVSINDNPKSAINLAKTICTEGQKLSEQFPGIVLLIFVPNSWSNYRQFNYHGETFDLHNYIKAFAAQHRFTTQFIEEKTLYDKMVCEISWWLSLALFVKALRTPWTLADLDQNTAYAGIGYSIKKQYSGKAEVILGCSHIYNAQGQGLRYKLSKVEHPQFDKKKNPYLNFEEAYKFGMDILALFQDAMEKLPQRVVVHKRTPFKNDEIEGITNALKQAGISEIDLITITQEYDLKFIAEKIMYGQFLEDGYPVDRGTCIKLSSRNALLWTHGVVPSIQSNRRYYQGGRCIPAPLKITKYYGHGDLETIAKEILGFTKMNWNSFNLYTKLPATIDTSNTLAQVGNLLRQYNGVTYDYRFFI